MADDNKKKQNTAETDELTLEEKINKIKSREITELRRVCLLCRHLKQPAKR